MKAPDKIYLQVCGECPKEDCKNCKFEDLEDKITWCKDRIFKKDIEYIRKNALLKFLASLEKDSAKNAGTDDLAYAAHEMVCQLIDKIKSL